MALTKRFKAFRDFLYDVRLKWYDIGVELEIDIADLDVIKSRYPDPADCLKEMLLLWLKSCDDPQLWKCLAEALSSKVIHEKALAKRANERSLNESFETKSPLTSPDHHYKGTSLPSGRTLSESRAPKRPLSGTNDSQWRPRLSSEPLAPTSHNDIRPLLERLRKQYDNFVTCLCQYLAREKKVNPGELRTFVLTLPAFRTEQKGRLMTGAKLNAAFHDAANKMSINDILSVIKEKCASFFHYGIFQCIKDEYCKGGVNPDLNYDAYFKAFIRMPVKISEFFNIVELKKDFITELKELVVEMDSIKMSRELMYLVEIRDNLASSLGLTTPALQLVMAREGRATFLIPVAVADCLFSTNKKLSAEDEEEVKHLPSVRSLSYGNYKIDCGAPKYEHSAAGSSILELSADEASEPNPHVGTKFGRLFIKGYKGNSIVIHHKNPTTYQLFHFIEEKAGIGAEKLRLLHSDMELEKCKETKISDYPEIDKNGLIVAVFQSPEKDSGGASSEAVVAQACPGCQTIVQRPAGEKKLVCPFCVKREFCSLCLQDWRSYGNKECGNEECTESHMLETFSMTLNPSSNRPKNENVQSQQRPGLDKLSSVVSIEMKEMTFVLAPSKLYVQGADGKKHIMQLPSSNFEVYRVADLCRNLESTLNLSMERHQLYHNGKPVDEWRHGRALVLGDYGIKSESTLLITETGMVMNVTNPTVDVCFVVDCTGSMQDYIEAVKNNIQLIHDKLVSEYQDCDLFFAFVRYTDYYEKSRTTYLDFTKNSESFQGFVGAIVAGGGKDIAEDVMGGLKLALEELKWRPEACKVLIHIADAPCHGAQYHTLGSSGDDFLAGDRFGLSHETMMAKVSELEIHYLFGYINKSLTDKMVEVFDKCLRDLSHDHLVIRQFDAIRPGDIGDEIIMSVKAAVYSNAALTNTAVREFTLDPSIPNWGTTWQEAKRTPRPEINQLSDLQEKECLDLSKPSHRITFRIAPNPFAEGSQYLVYRGKDHVNLQDIVLKRFKLCGEEFNSVDCYMKKLEVCTIAKAYAKEFNSDKRKPATSTRLILDFLPLDVIQCTDGMLYVAESFLEEPLKRFCEEDSNAGDCHSLLQAFSHYTWDKSKSLLVCNLKGCKVQEELVLTDPTIHSRGCGRKYGFLDEGSKGVRRFFEAHTCSDYCKSMKLPPPDFP